MEETHRESVTKQVQLVDIEDAAYGPPGSNIVGIHVGNWMWRSPEAHAEARVSKPSDIFSFGVVVSCKAFLSTVKWLLNYHFCTVHIRHAKRVIFAVNAEELAEGEERLSVVLERQILTLRTKMYWMGC